MAQEKEHSQEGDKGSRRRHGEMSLLTIVGSRRRLPTHIVVVYTTSHFHSTSHEVLCISNGRAKLCFGGEDNEGRIEPTVNAGDVIIVPAGVAHRLLEDLSESGGSFEMVGSYPKGFDWDMCYGKQGEEKKIANIKRLAWFDRDPVYGEKGPVLDA